MQDQFGDSMRPEMFHCATLTVLGEAMRLGQILFLGVVASPLQLVNLQSYLRKNEIPPSSTLILVIFSGTVTADDQIFRGLTHMSPDTKLFLIGNRRKVSAKARMHGIQNASLQLWPKPFGKSALGIGLVLSRLLISGTLKISCWSDLQHLALGNGMCRAQSLTGICASKTTSVVLTDDGVMTLRIAEWRSRQPNFRPTASRRLYPLAWQWRRPITFFTLFHKIAVRTNDSIVPNFPALKAQGGLVAKAGTWILGTPVVEQGLCDESDYENAIDRVLAQVCRQGDQVEYLPHRRENPALVELRCKRFGMKLGGTAFSVEDRVRISGEYADRIVGFASTGTAILAFLVPDSCVLFSAPAPIKKACQQKEQVHRIQRYYSSISRVMVLD